MFQTHSKENGTTLLLMLATAEPIILFYSIENMVLFSGIFM